MKRVGTLILFLLLLPTIVFAYSGAGSIMGWPKGYFIPVNFKGDSTGFGQARDLCLARGGGVISLGPGLENLVYTTPVPANITIEKMFSTGWGAYPFTPDVISTDYFSVTDSLNVYGKVFIEDSLNIQGRVAIYDSLKVYGKTFVEDSLNVQGKLFIDNSLRVGKSTILQGDLTINPVSGIPSVLLFGGRNASELTAEGLLAA